MLLLREKCCCCCCCYCCCSVAGVATHTPVMDGPAGDLLAPLRFTRASCRAIGLKPHAVGRQCQGFPVTPLGASVQRSALVPASLHKQDNHRPPPTSSSFGSRRSLALLLNGLYRNIAKRRWCNRLGGSLRGQRALPTTRSDLPVTPAKKSAAV